MQDITSPLHKRPVETSDRPMGKYSLPITGEEISLRYEGHMEARVTARNPDGTISVLTNCCELRLEFPKLADEWQYDGYGG